MHSSEWHILNLHYYITLPIFYGQMKAKICWVKGDVEDHMVIEADSVEELQRMAAEIVETRKPDDYWSEPA